MKGELADRDLASMWSWVYQAWAGLELEPGRAGGKKAHSGMIRDQPSLSSLAPYTGCPCSISVSLSLPKISSPATSTSSAPVLPLRSRPGRILCPSPLTGHLCSPSQASPLPPWRYHSLPGVAGGSFLKHQGDHITCCSQPSSGNHRMVINSKPFSGLKVKSRFQGA